ncbi:chaperonin 10-like protein [Leptodontidium sp. MPI-SDFR-AT-0119]|nr:chaperonin 10-like protein [Leptodontidium sp. MPI-SDFR-AT-0119]
MSQSKNLAAFLPAAASPLTIGERPIPTPGPGEILVRNYALAVNPVDWKRRDWGFAIPSYPTILGSDVSGIVDSVGPDVTLFAAGDRVFGFADGFSSGKLDNSSFQTYTIVPVVTASKLPDSIDFEHGVMLPMAVATASIALFKDLGLPRPGSVDVKQGAGSLLVWGGASALGSMAIQLGNLAGFTVYAAASPIHDAYLKSLGATATFDYRSPTIVEDIIAAAKRAGQPITRALDVISEASTLKLTGQVLLGSAGKNVKLAHVLPWPETETVPEGVETFNVSGEHSWTTRKDLSIWLFHEFLPSALATGTIVPSPKLEIVEGGLSGLEAGMELVKKGVSAKKIVVTLG